MQHAICGHGFLLCRQRIASSDHKTAQLNAVFGIGKVVHGIVRAFSLRIEFHCATRWTREDRGPSFGSRRGGRCAAYGELGLVRSPMQIPHG